MTLSLTAEEVSHVLFMLDWSKRDDTYYGEKDEYFARHERIREKILTRVVAERAWKAANPAKPRPKK